MKTIYHKGDIVEYSDFVPWEPVTILEVIETAPRRIAVYKIQFEDGTIQWTTQESLRPKQEGE